MAIGKVAAASEKINSTDGVNQTNVSVPRQESYKRLNHSRYGLEMRSNNSGDELSSGFGLISFGKLDFN